MDVRSLDSSGLLDRALEFASTNIRIERILIALGLDPNNLTYEAIFNRLLEVLLDHIAFASVFAAIGGIFLILSFVSRTIVPMRILSIVSIVFFIGASLLGSVPR